MFKDHRYPKRPRVTSVVWSPDTWVLTSPQVLKIKVSFDQTKLNHEREKDIPLPVITVLYCTGLVWDMKYTVLRLHDKDIIIQCEGGVSLLSN